MCFSIGLRVFVSFLCVLVFVCVCVCLLLFLFLFVCVYFCVCVFLFISAKLRCVFSIDPGRMVLSSDNSFYLTFLPIEPH